MSNINVTPGTGKTVATETIAGVEYPQLKLIDSTASSTSPIGVAANPLQVSLANTASNSTAVKVDASATTQPVSAASLPLPSGAATSAKQPALGSAGSASSDVITIQGIASMTAVKVDNSGVTQPVSGTVTSVGAAASGASKSGNPVQIGGVFNNTQPTVTTGQAVEAQYTSRGAAIVATGTDTFNVTVATSLPAGSNTIGALSANQSVNLAQVNGGTINTGNGTASGSQRVAIASDQTAFGVNAVQSGTWTVQPGNTANTTPWLVTATPGTTGGWTPSLQNGLSTTPATVKGSAGTLGGYFIYNPNSSVAYVQIFDISGSVTLGTSVPKLSLGIPATSAANLEMTNGNNFANAIKVAATTTATGNTAPGTALDCNFWFK